MSYHDLPLHVRTAAEEVLTRRQLEAFKHWCADSRYSMIGIRMDISETRARMLVTRALQKIKIATRGEAA